MPPYYATDRATLHHGDALAVLQQMPTASVDAVVTDPPYDLTSSGNGGFMGLAWDATGIAFRPAVWQELRRVAKPGAHLLSFGGTRTYHRMACAIEDAGWEIRDCLVWLHAQGFPKALDVSKALDKIRDRSKLARLSAEIARARAEADISLRELGQRMQTATGGQYGAWYHRGGHMFFETGMSLPSRPEWEHLRRVLPIAPSWDDVYDAAERDVIGHSENGIAGGTHRHAGQDGAWGFNRAHDITAPATDLARQWEGWHTALKPALEPIVLARAPLGAPTVAGNIAAFGVGALNIDGCRIGTTDPLNGGAHAVNGQPRHDGAKNWRYKIGGAGEYRQPAGRWPSNCVLSHTLWCVPAGVRRVRSGTVVSPSKNKVPHVYGGGLVGLPSDAGYTYADPDGYETVEAWECHEACPVRALDAQSGERRSGRLEPHHGQGGLPRKFAGDFRQGTKVARTYGGDTGGASRFFFVSKPSPRERSDGLPDGERNSHPTVKAIELCRYLARLITPPGGTILDPFAGTASIGCAALLEGMRYIGIEQSAEYCALAEARLRHWAGQAGEVPA